MIKDTLGLVAFLLVFILLVPLVILCGIGFFAAKFKKEKRAQKYFFNALYGIDQAANIVLAGHPEETISSRLGRAEMVGYRYYWVKLLRIVVDLLSKPLDGPRHCHRAAQYEGLKMNIKSREVWNWNKEG